MKLFVRLFKSKRIEIKSFGAEFTKFEIELARD